MIPPELMREIVRRKFSEATSRWTSLAGGKTNRVWRIDATGGVIICKLFCQPDGNPLYPNQPGAEYEALKYLARHQVAPEPVALLNTAAGDALIYRHLHGDLWRTDVVEVAALLARIHTLKPDIPLRQLRSGSVALLHQIKSIGPTFQNRVDVLLNADKLTLVGPVEQDMIIHTDVVANNIVVTNDGVRLIDWQCPALGDPCEDIASFLSPAMQYLYTGGPLNARQKMLFLDAYPDKNIIARYKKLAPLFHLRAAAYCFWQAERGHYEYREAAEYEFLALEEFSSKHDQTR